MITVMYFNERKRNTAAINSKKMACGAGQFVTNATALATPCTTGSITIFKGLWNFKLVPPVNRPAIHSAGRQGC